MTRVIQLILAITLGSMVLMAPGCSRRQGDQASRQVGEVVQAAGDEASDATVTARVKSALIASDRLDTSRVNVDTENGIVYLRGTVPNENQKRLAGEITRNTVASSVTVRNQLRTSGSPGRYQ